MTIASVVESRDDKDDNNHRHNNEGREQQQEKDVENLAEGKMEIE